MSCKNDPIDELGQRLGRMLRRACDAKECTKSEAHDLLLALLGAAGELQPEELPRRLRPRLIQVSEQPEASMSLATSNLVQRFVTLLEEAGTQRSQAISRAARRLFDMPAQTAPKTSGPSRDWLNVRLVQSAS